LSEFDRRLHAFRSDLADARLKHRVEATRYVEGRAARVAAPVADLHGRRDTGSGIDTQLLRGDEVTVFEEANGWAWLQASRDGYVGYVPYEALGPQEPAPTHLVIAPRTFVYPGLDIKLPPTSCHSMGAGFAIVDFAENRGVRYATLSSGAAIVARHVAPADWQAGDFVAVAEELLGTPYLWGGTSAFGVDCSGIVQLAMRMAGRVVLRDTDMQATTIGEPLAPGADFENLQRGDLVFWKGHVGIMRDGATLLHANGHTMTVVSEKLAEAVSRIEHLYGKPTGFRRP
jgi:cell wall-associated NlpC family hydrolase